MYSILYVPVYINKKVNPFKNRPSIWYWQWLVHQLHMSEPNQRAAARNISASAGGSSRFHPGGIPGARGRSEVFTEGDGQEGWILVKMCFTIVYRWLIRVNEDFISRSFQLWFPRKKTWSAMVIFEALFGHGPAPRLGKKTNPPRNVSVFDW